jgi:hypothetical protein
MIQLSTIHPDGTEFKDNDLVCHCFQYTRKHIEEDFLKHRRSMILEKIMFEKRIGGCDCAEKNPKGH